MVSMPRPVRAALATALLVGGTVVPTVVVTVKVWQSRGPAHAREVADELGRRLGVQVSIERVRHPRPGYDEFEGVVLRREVGGGRGSRLAEFLRCDALVREADEGGDVLRAVGLTLRGEDAQVLAGEVLTLARGLARDGRLDLTAPSARVELKREGAPVVVAVRDLAIVLEPRGPELILSASFRAGAGDGVRCELLAADAPSETGRATTLSLQTPEGPAPLGLLAAAFSASSWFGDSATMKGRFDAHWTTGVAPDVTYQGSIDGIDLAHLVEARFPGRRIEGMARLDEVEARWTTLPGGQGRGWTSARGRLSAGPGSIGRPFFDAMITNLGFRLAVAPRPGDDVPFRQLALAFELRPDGTFALDSASDSMPGGAVLLAGSGEVPLLLAPRERGDVRGLWKTLFPWDEATLAPVTAESRVLEHLPLPALPPLGRRGVPAN